MKSTNDNDIYVNYEGKSIKIIKYIEIMNSKKNSNRSDIEMMLDVLPHELWEAILLNMSYLEINKLCVENPVIDIYCRENNILEKRKMKGFPRISGHCICHDVSHLKIKLSDYYDAFDDIDETSRNPYIRLQNVSTPKMNEIMAPLELSNGGLVYGDLIFYGKMNDSRSTCIFDGTKIIFLNFDAMDGYGTIPPEFAVITNNVPMNYWDCEVVDGKIIKKGLDTNSTLWLNILQIREQCINNIKKNSDSIVTTFKHNNVVYSIYYMSDGEYDIEKYFDDLLKVLSERSVLMLSRRDFTESFNGEITETTLFIDVEYCQYYV